MPGPRRPRVETGFDKISPEDIIALGEFLDCEPRAKLCMSIAVLDGFLTAIVIGPEMVLPSDYLPLIWDAEEGKKDPGFADLDEAKRILGYVQGMNNRVAGPLRSETPTVTPVFVFEPAWDHREWLIGFAMGSEFDPDVWERAEVQEVLWGDG